jgi:hypothetical protein
MRAVLETSTVRRVDIEGVQGRIRGGRFVSAITQCDGAHVPKVRGVQCRGGAVDIGTGPP